MLGAIRTADVLAAWGVSPFRGLVSHRMIGETVVSPIIRFVVFGNGLNKTSRSPDDMEPRGRVSEEVMGITAETVPGFVCDLLAGCSGRLMLWPWRAADRITSALLYH